MRNTKVLAISMTGVLLLPACGSSPDGDGYLPDQRLQYKKQREAAENLEVPPDLTAGNFDDAMDVPPLGGTTTYSEYVGGQSAQRRIAGSSKILPAMRDVKLRREGNNRWLEIEGSPRQVWLKVIGFWRSQGILLVEQDPSTGIMKTDWLENRAEIRRDFITNIVSKVAEGLYATGQRDQYRVRIEPGLQAGTTDLYLTHRAMEERLRKNTAGEAISSIWEATPTDPGKEATMLRRLMVHLGVSEQPESGLAARKQPATGGAKSQLVKGPGGESLLIISDEYRRAWRLTGVALDRVGFAVEDRDRTRGIYYVRYDDPARVDEKKKSWSSRLAFWRRDDEKDQGPVQYQVKLMSDGARTRVAVRDRIGQPASSTTADRILWLLQGQIR